MLINSCRHCRHEQSTERRSGAQGNEVSSAVTRPAQARADDLRRRCRATLDGVEGKCRARCSGTAFTQRLPTAVRHAIIGQLSAHTTDAGSANHLTQECPGSARCLVAEHRWDPRVRVEAEFGWRLQVLRTAAKRRGQQTASTAPKPDFRPGAAVKPRSRAAVRRRRRA